MRCKHQSQQEIEEARIAQKLFIDQGNQFSSAAMEFVIYYLESITEAVLKHKKGVLIRTPNSLLRLDGIDY